MTLTKLKQIPAYHDKPLIFTGQRLGRAPFVSEEFAVGDKGDPKALLLIAATCEGRDGHHSYPTLSLDPLLAPIL